MKTNHHYVPVAVTFRFSGPVADDLYQRLGLPETAIQHYRYVRANRSEYRKWPVLVWSKRQRALRVQPAQAVFFAKNLYQVPEYADPVKRAALKFILSEHIDLERPRPPDHAFLSTMVRWGADGVPRDIVEQFFADRVDGPFSRLLQKLHSGRPISVDNTRGLGTFFSLAMHRTPGAKFATSVLHTDTIERIVRRLDRERPPSGPHAADLNRFQQAYLAVEKETSWLSSMMHSADKRIGPFVTGAYEIALLSAPEGLSFICADNPARPFNLRRPLNQKNYRMPGFRRRSTVAVYPLTPKLCLLARREDSGPRFADSVASAGLVRRINGALFRLAVDDVVLPNLFMRNFPADFDPYAVKPWEERAVFRPSHRDIDQSVSRRLWQPN